jgi:hypothetical protein
MSSEFHRMLTAVMIDLSRVLPSIAYPHQGDHSALVPATPDEPPLSMQDRLITTQGASFVAVVLI